MRKKCSYYSSRGLSLERVVGVGWRRLWRWPQFVGRSKKGSVLRNCVVLTGRHHKSSDRRSVGCSGQLKMCCTVCSSRPNIAQTWLKSVKIATLQNFELEVHSNTVVFSINQWTRTWKQKKNSWNSCQPSKVMENHFYWKKSQLLKENEVLNIPKCHVLPKRRMPASKSYMIAVNMYEDHIHKILGWRTRWQKNS